MSLNISPLSFETYSINGSAVDGKVLENSKKLERNLPQSSQ